MTEHKEHREEDFETRTVRILSGKLTEEERSFWNACHSYYKLLYTETPPELKVGIFRVLGGHAKPKNEWERKALKFVDDLSTAREKLIEVNPLSESIINTLVENEINTPLAEASRNSS